MIKTLIAGNWKMHLNVSQSGDLAKSVDTQAKAVASKVETVLFPSLLALTTLQNTLKTAKLGAQNIYFADEGAFTGEVSATQVTGLVDYALVGHSERRHIFQESNEMVARKAAACVRNQITPIICVGETQHEREEGEAVQVINDQIAAGLTMLVGQDLENCVIAYEPVWAIGTGNNADPQDAAKAIRAIRSAIAGMFGADVATSVRVIYGGSVQADTAGSYLSLEGVNGLLVGGASLNGHEFNAIIKRAAHGNKQA